MSIENSLDNELRKAQSTNVERHSKPVAIAFETLDFGVGGTLRLPNPRVRAANANCAGGKPKNVTNFRGSIMAECGACGMSVYWDTRLKVWTTST